MRISNVVTPQSC